ncbi:cytochrome P450 (plasmid) [Streptomyces sp. NBC_01717]|uniref:cytochrome P450 n=1 Tax=Streptomyces sp. NBC_01717 TaxID=2975918 RepID=UPI002E2FB3E1|nr:cytochrome P450 [Streptomyces sp. NBC_01717]
MTNSPSSSAHAVPTAPGRVPLLGHIPSVLRHSPVATLRSLQAYGDIVALHLGPATVYVVNSPDLIHRMLVTEADNYRKGRLFTRSADMVGNGIANSDGEFHHRQRRLILPAFHRTRMRAYGDVMRGQTEAISDAWQPGTVLPLEKEMNRLTARVTAKTLFTSELGDRAVAEVQETVPIMTKEAMRRVMVPDVINRLPTPGNRRFFAAIARIRKVLDEVISAYEEQGVDHGDLLSVLLRARDEETGEGMTHVQVRDELVTLLAAGTEATGTALSWLFYEITRHPEVEERLLAELEAVLADRPVTFDDLPKLEYAARVVDETLRLRTPGWMSMRRTRADVELGGVHIPAGTELIYSPHAVHHNPQHYPDAERFDPDRWLSAPADRRTFISFGAGKHKCVGDHFARTMMLIVLATIVRKRRLTTVPGYKLREVAAINLRPKTLPMTVEARAE